MRPPRAQYAQYAQYAQCVFTICLSDVIAGHTFNHLLRNESKVIFTAIQYFIFSGDLQGINSYFIVKGIFFAKL